MNTTPTAATSAPGGRITANGVDMYYEVHGQGEPLVLLHGALVGIGSCFGALLPELARERRVIAVEMQAHGRTPDIDRPLRVEHLAEDIAALVEGLGLGEVDVLGYSMGAAVAFQLALTRPRLVRRLVLVSVSFRADGMYPEVAAGIGELSPQDLEGTPFHEEYVAVAPDPGGWAALVERVKEMDAPGNIPEWTPEQVSSVAAPTLLALGDSDIVRPEHAAAMFRLLGGGVPGDLTGLPAARLAVLPGTTHIGAMEREEYLAPMVAEFLAAGAGDAEGADPS
ncbi:alpha/beta hydrolase [Nocardiopsis sp. RSe5-2]|uniref:Alpha/beta hydrolase n=1 Tax=Nocardiopsis endophytica TaxID=3018445 RepID=A0ABT4UD61_9ACTN|nr:alpha/beta hydrolase [Nocardiopsis endophytica]MDA2814295.1 alpha/beta hydrolase [Nocardiopsis endophytica]